MDLTVLATPFYFGSMEAERRWLRHRSGDERYSAGQYERRDTVTNLTMGTASLVTPLLFDQVRRRVEWGRGSWAKPLAAMAVGAAGVTVVADAVRRRLDKNPSDDPRWLRRRRRAADVAGAGAVAAIGSAGLLVAGTWTAKMAPGRLWARRRRDLGDGIVPLALAVLGWDAIYYWNHRFMHESRYMWAIHVVHHSSERYNLSVALRQPVADLFGTFVPYGLLCLLGIRPSHVRTARDLNLLYQYWIHTEAIPQLGPAEEVLNTPSAHRVHHGANRQYIDRNHGSILIVWDRLFGTFEREQEPVVYGLTRNIRTFAPIRVALHEHLDIARDVFRSENWRDRLSFVLRGPGWAYERHREREEREAVGSPSEEAIAQPA